MGSNSFISHRMFVAALKGAEASPPSAAIDSGVPARKIPGPRTAQQFAARVAQHWFDFPFARATERRVT
jgi:hypothetical protein